MHQEDICQARGILPTRKYENEGDPSAFDIVVELLRTLSGRPRSTMSNGSSRPLAFNWLIAGTDAHAKNFSLLIGAEGRARLAPLYDIASILPL